MKVSIIHHILIHRKRLLKHRTLTSLIIYISTYVHSEHDDFRVSVATRVNGGQPALVARGCGTGRAVLQARAMTRERARGRPRPPKA